MDTVEELHPLLNASPIFGALDTTLRSLLAAAMRAQLVAPGHVLLRQGDVGDALFLVGRGQLEVRLRRDDGREALIDTVGRGDVIGEMQLVVGGAASASVAAASEAQVFRLQRDDFDALCAHAPALLDTLARVAARRLQRRQMLAVLPALFGTLDGTDLAALERHVTWRTLRRGDVLFHKGERGDAWYVVTSGRLAVVEPAADGQPERLLSEVGRGEGVGEMALLTGQARSATVYALRDAELARFPSELVSELLATRPQVTQAMLRGLALRVMQQSGTPRRADASGLTLTLVPASPQVDIADLARRLTAALGRIGAARQVSSAHLHEVGVGHEAAQRPDTHPTWIRVGAWLDEQSSAHRYLVLVADATSNAWSARAVGHADRVILVGNANADPMPGALERTLLPSAAGQRDVRRLLVLLHRDGTQPARGTARWLDARTVEAHLHVRLDRNDDIERLARRLAGQGVALTLSGGGARCCAHMGVVRALREHGIPIDLVTGTSAGSLAGYLAATGASDEAMRHSALRFFQARPFKGYTLPLYSLLDGDRLSRALQDQCGDTQLEDLWLPLVVVSANLTRRAVELHTRGPAWQALRASCSLPGLVEPLIRDGELLVDGGLIDNLPVGVARERLAGRVIAVDVTADLDVRTSASAYPSRWLEFAARVAKRRGRLPGAPPGMFEVMLHSLLLASLAHTQRMRLEADLCLRPNLAGFGLLALGSHAEIIEAGYRYAREHLAAFTATQPVRSLLNSRERFPLLQ
jgi:predicted acylesterase/phospholipase RssA/CRP-like cAMP-binding protein